MMPGRPHFLDLVQVWCLAFEIMTRTACEMPAAFVRELHPPPQRGEVISHAGRH